MEVVLVVVALVEIVVVVTFIGVRVYRAWKQAKHDALVAQMDAALLPPPIDYDRVKYVKRVATMEAWIGRDGQVIRRDHRGLPR